MTNVDAAWERLKGNQSFPPLSAPKYGEEVFEYVLDSVFLSDEAIDFALALLKQMDPDEHCARLRRWPNSTSCPPRARNPAATPNIPASGRSRSERPGIGSPSNTSPTGTRRIAQIHSLIGSRNSVEKTRDVEKVKTS